MALTLIVRLRAERYDAAALRPSEAEWPPHPARLFCALVASATEPADWEALRWLEAQPPPDVHSAMDHTDTTASGFVVTNSIEAKGKSQTWPGRINGFKQRASVSPASDRFAICWPSAEPDDATLGRILRLARRVPYLGRSTCPAEVSVVPSTPEPDSSWQQWRPTTLGAARSEELRVPFSGYTDTLRDTYAQGGRAWEVGRTLAYAPYDDRTSAAGADSPVASPYSDLLIFAIERPSVPVSGDRLLSITDALRQAVISRVPDPVPAQVCGHGADGRPHVAYLALLDVGFRYSDGHILGVGVAVPDGLTRADRLALLRSIAHPDHPLRELSAGRIRLGLRYADGTPVTRGLMPDRWIAVRGGGARTWVTATPVMLDRFSSADQVPATVATAVCTAGLPEPESVEILPGAVPAGAVYLPRRGTIPPNRPRRPMVHCRITFARPVLGPILVGALRYLGCGVFVPDWWKRSGDLSRQLADVGDPYGGRDADR